MKLRKAAAMLFAVLLFALVPVLAGAKTFTTEQFTMEVPEGMYQLGPDTPADDPAWALAGVADPTQTLKDYKERSAIANFISEDGKLNILVMTKETDTSKRIFNFSTLSEEEKTQFLADLMKSDSEEVTVKNEVYKGEQVSYYHTSIDGVFEGKEAHEVVYGTIVNGAILNVDLYANGKAFTEEQLATGKSLVDSIRFTEILDKPEAVVASTGDIAVTLALLGLLVVVILIPLIYFPLKGRRDKKLKSQLAEKLTEYHKTHGNNDAASGEMRFANSTDCTREAIHTFSIYQAYIKNVGSLAVGAFLSLATLAVSFLLDSEWWIKLVAVAIVAYYGYKIFNMPHTIEKIQRKVYERGTSDTAHYAFYDEAFRVSGIQSASLFPYFQITDVRRKGQYLYLYYGPDNAYMVDRYGFSLGEYEEFVKFISEKTGKKL